MATGAHWHSPSNEAALLSSEARPPLGVALESCCPCGGTSHEPSCRCCHVGQAPRAARAGCPLCAPHVTARQRGNRAKPGAVACRRMGSTTPAPHPKARDDRKRKSRCAEHAQRLGWERLAFGATE